MKKMMATIISFLILLPTVSSRAEKMELNILSWDAGYVKPYEVDFIKMIDEKYGVDLVIHSEYAVSYDDYWRFARLKKADLMTITHFQLKSDKWKFIESNTVLPIDMKNISNYQYIMKKLRDSRFIIENGNLYGVPYNMGSYGLAYNSDLVEEPKSWGILWEDSAKKYYSLSDEFCENNIYVTALVLGYDYSILYDYDTFFGKIDSDVFMKKIHELKRNAFSLFGVFPNLDEMKNKLKYTTTWGWAIAKVNSEGGNWKIADPKEGCTMFFNTWSIGVSLKNEPEKKRIAEEWINYSLSPEVQGKIIDNVGHVPVTTNLEGVVSEKDVAIFRVGNEEYWGEFSLWENLNSRTKNGYKVLWENLK